jgi:choline dehydrogenase
MAQGFSGKITAVREATRLVESGKFNRREALRLFGVSAAAFGLHLAGCAKRPQYDYIIVGAGSAGCTLAARLLASSQAHILLIEAGGSNERQEIRDFTQAYRLTRPDSKVDWGFKSEPQSALLDKPQPYSVGRVLGGSSSINGMVWVRGNRADFDSWAATGATGWDYASVLPSFQALTGPIHPSSELTARNALSQAVVAAAVKLGHRFNPDYNGEDQYGVAYTQLNVVHGVRQDAFTAFLTPYLGEPRLTIMTDAVVKRLTFDRSRAVDQVVIDAQGREFGVSAEREVILCGGTINTPQLLQLSGIGAAADIERHGIAMVADVPGVGQNLQDHLTSVVAKQVKEAPPPSHVTAMDVNVFTGRQSATGAPRFEIQSYYLRYGWGPYPPNTLSFGVMNLHPTSRGFVKLRSADPRTPPIIQPHLLDTAEDLANQLEGYGIIREMINSSALRDWVAAEETVPGPAVRTNDQVTAAIRKYSEADFHAVGTCKMGTDESAVVDPQLRVRGVKGLRLASAAIMPTVVSGNTNAAAMMIGDRCGRWVLGLA